MVPPAFLLPAQEPITKREGREHWFPLLPQGKEGALSNAVPSVVSCPQLHTGGSKRTLLGSG